MRIVVLNIDVTLMCLDQYKMTALRFAQTSAEEREKTIITEKQQDIAVNIGALKICKAYSKGEKNDYERFNCEKWTNCKATFTN